MLEKSYQSPRIFTLQIYISSLFFSLGSLLFREKKKIYGAPMKPSELFCFKDNEFCSVIIFLSGKCDRIRIWCKWIHPKIPEDWLKTGWAKDSQTRTRLVDSLFCITCSFENNTFSVLHHVIKVTLYYLLSHRFEIHSALKLSRTALLGCRLAAKTRGCSSIIRPFHVLVVQKRRRYVQESVLHVRSCCFAF